jgi:hypothetical protein
MGAGSSTGNKSKVYDEADAYMFRKGANDAYKVIRQVTRAENELTLADVLTFIAAQNIQVDTKAQTRLDEFNELVSRTLYKPPTYNNAYISGLRTTYELFVDDRLLKDRTANGWNNKLHYYALKLTDPMTVTSEEFDRYITAVLVEKADKAKATDSNHLTFRSSVRVKKPVAKDEPPPAAIDEPPRPVADRTRTSAPRSPPPRPVGPSKKSSTKTGGRPVKKSAAKAGGPSNKSYFGKIY